MTPFSILNVSISLRLDFLFFLHFFLHYSTPLSGQLARGTINGYRPLHSSIAVRTLRKISHAVEYDTPNIPCNRRGRHTPFIIGHLIHREKSLA